MRGALLPLFAAQIAGRWRGCGEGRGAGYWTHLHQLVNTYTLTPERHGGAPTEHSGARGDQQTYTRRIDTQPQRRSRQRANTRKELFDILAHMHTNKTACTRTSLCEISKFEPAVKLSKRQRITSLINAATLLFYIFYTWTRTTTKQDTPIHLPKTSHLKQKEHINAPKLLIKTL